MLNVKKISLPPIPKVTLNLKEYMTCMLYLIFSLRSFCKPFTPSSSLFLIAPRGCFITSPTRGHFHMVARLSFLWICQLPASQTSVESVAHQIQMPSLCHLSSTVSLVLTHHPLHHAPCGLVRMNLMLLCSALREELMLCADRQTSDILQTWCQTTSIKSKYHKKRESHEFLVSQCI